MAARKPPRTTITRTTRVRKVGGRGSGAKATVASSRLRSRRAAEVGTAEEQQSSASEQPSEGQIAQVETPLAAEPNVPDVSQLSEGAASPADIRGSDPTTKQPRTRRRVRTTSLAEASSVAPVEAAPENTSDSGAGSVGGRRRNPGTKKEAGGSTSNGRRRAGRAGARGENAKVLGLAPDGSAPQATQAELPQPLPLEEQGPAVDRAAAEGPLSTGLGLAKALGDEMANFSQRLITEGTVRAKEIASARTLAELVSIQARHLQVESGAWLRHTSRLSEIYLASLRGLGRE